MKDNYPTLYDSYMNEISNSGDVTLLCTDKPYDRRYWQVK
jgi:hypothetical protein